MFCRKCGKEIDEGSTFCNYCGEKVEHANQAEETEDVKVNDVSMTNSSEVGNEYEPVSEHEELFDSYEIYPRENNKEAAVVKNHEEKSEIFKENHWYNQQKNDESRMKMKTKLAHDVNINLGRSTIACIIVTAFIIAFTVLAIVSNSSKSKKDDMPAKKEKLKIEQEEYKTTPESYENAEERWDAENCIYANFKHGIVFELPKDLVWTKVSGTSKHTVVKFLQPNSGIVLFANINPIDNYSGGDIWDKYDQIISYYDSYITTLVEENSAEKILESNYEKAIICGQHAIKWMYKSEIRDDRLEETEKVYNLDYIFVYNGSTVTVSFKANQDVVESMAEQDISPNDFIRCFNVTNISPEFEGRAQHDEKKSKLAIMLTQAAKHLNDQCPLRIDDYTTIQNVIFNGKDLIYKEVIDATAYAKYGIDVKALKTRMKQNLKASVPQLKQFAETMKKYDFGISFYYYTEQGELKKIIRMTSSDLLN